MKLFNRPSAGLWSKSLVALFFAFSQVLSAQYTEVGIGLGQSVYWGDLNAPEFSTNLSNREWAGQAYVRYNHTPKLSFRAALLVAQLSGDDRNSPIDWQQQRNLRFTNTLVEVSLNAEYYLFGMDHNAGQVFSPYLTGGLAFFRHNPMTDYLGQTVALQPLGTEGQGLAGFDDKYSLVNLAIPFGGGAKISITDKLSVNIAIVGRRTFTDYLDDVGGTYVNYDELSAGNGELAAILGNRMAESMGSSEPIYVETGAKRGGETVRDYFFTFMVSVNYYLKSTDAFSKSSRVSTSNCPTF